MLGRKRISSRQPKCPGNRGEVLLKESPREKIRLLLRDLDLMRLLNVFLSNELDVKLLFFSLYYRQGTKPAHKLTVLLVNDCRQICCHLGGLGARLLFHDGLVCKVANHPAFQFLRSREVSLSRDVLKVHVRVRGNLRGPPVKCRRRPVGQKRRLLNHRKWYCVRQGLTTCTLAEAVTLPPRP